MHITARSLALVGIIAVTTLTQASAAFAHGIGAEHETVREASFFGFMGLGVQHMISGYDHLLFVAGIVLLVRKFKDVVKFITAFTVGHSITLLIASLAGWSVNARFIDAMIALSVAYIGAEIIWGERLRKQTDDEPTGRRRLLDPRLIVFLFGLLHGLGLATRFQALGVAEDGIVRSILGFNVGVELGQLAALVLFVSVAILLRTFKSYEKLRRIIGFALIAAGFIICATLVLAGAF